MKVELNVDDEVEIEFEACGVTTSAAVTPVGPRLFRLESVPVFVEEATYGDTIEAEIISEMRLRFVRVAQAGGWHVHSCVVSSSWMNTGIQAVADEAVRRGGHWECMFGGLLMICMPPDSDWDPSAALDDLNP